MKVLTNTNMKSLLNIKVPAAILAFMDRLHLILLTNIGAMFANKGALRADKGTMFACKGALRTDKGAMLASIIHNPNGFRINY